MVIAHAMVTRCDTQVYFPLFFVALLNCMVSITAFIATNIEPHANWHVASGNW